MRKTLLDAPPLSVVSPGKSVSASIQAGASWVFEFCGAVWRRSSQALSGIGWAVASGGAGGGSVNASCAHTRHTAARKIANAARTNIQLAGVLAPRVLCKPSLAVRAELGGVRHVHFRRQH